MPETKVGIGYDIHRLEEGRKLFVGGIEIPYIKGLVGHSDGDVLLHALCDALLGASGRADIGECFPDTDPQYAGVSSMQFLRSAVRCLSESGFSVTNVDAVVIAAEPNFQPFKKAMREAIAGALGIPQDRVNIKAKTNNGLGDTGRGQAIASLAVASITKE